MEELKFNKEELLRIQEMSINEQRRICRLTGNFFNEYIEFNDKLIQKIGDMLSQIILRR